MSDAKKSILDKRIKVDQVARILHLIATHPNRRETRQDDDLEGDYDYWFDGGAMKMITGTTRYVFVDGTTAQMDVVPMLSVRIVFRDGRTVSIHQHQ